MEEKRLILRLRWDGPVLAGAPHPGEEARGRTTEFGMQRGRDEVVAGEKQSDGMVLYEAEVAAYMDARERLRYEVRLSRGRRKSRFSTSRSAR